MADRRRRTALRALIVDDAPLLRTVLATHLAALGASIAGESADIEEALRDAAALAPDVIFLDARLPGVGPAAVASLRAAVPDATIVPIIALSETALARRLLDAGAKDVLLRPFLRSRIAALVDALREDP